MSVVASAPGKITLLGECFVAYGEPAIVLAMAKRANAKVELRKDTRLYARSVNLSGYYENERFTIEQVRNAIMEAGGRPFVAKKSDEGVKIERT